MNSGRTAKLAAHDDNLVNHHDSDKDSSGGSGLRPAVREAALKSIPPPTESIDSAWGEEDEEETASPAAAATEHRSTPPAPVAPARDSEDPRVEVGVLTAPDDLLDSAWDDVEADSMFPPPVAEQPAPTSARDRSEPATQRASAAAPAIPRSPAVPRDLEKLRKSTPPKVERTLTEAKSTAPNSTGPAKATATASERRLSSIPKAAEPRPSGSPVRASVPPSVRPVSVVPRATVSSSVRARASSPPISMALKSDPSSVKERPALKSVPPPKRAVAGQTKLEPAEATGLVVDADDVVVITTAEPAEPKQAAEPVAKADESIVAAAVEPKAEEPAEPREEVIVDAGNLPDFVRAVTAAVPQATPSLKREGAVVPPSQPTSEPADSVADSAPVPLVRVRSVPPPASTSSPPGSEDDEPESAPGSEDATDADLSSVGRPSRSLPLSKWHWAAGATALIAAGIAFMLASRPDSAEPADVAVAAAPKIETPAPPAAVKPRPPEKRAEPVAAAQEQQDDAREPEPAAQPRQVQVTVDPENARVYHDGKKLGEGNLTVSVEPGETKKLRVMYRGYRIQSIVLDGSEPEVSVKLKRRGAKKKVAEEKAAASAAGPDAPPETGEEAAPPVPKRPPPTTLPPPWARRETDNPY